MRALLWKELRENLKWALLGMVVLGAALCYGLYHTREGLYSYSYDGVTLLGKQFLLVTTFGFPAMGLFLGLMQVLPELKRDRWVALLHRPVPHDTIFAGKIVAGMMLYGLAAGLPLAMTVWLAATPGNFAAPFVPGLILPGLADLLVGLVYYLAAFAMTLPRRGWMERLIPLLAAVYISFVVLDTHLFRVAAAASLAMTLTLAVACWGIIQKPESLTGRAWLPRFALIAVMFYGICGLGGLGRALLDVVGPEPRRETLRYEISKSGIPLRLRYLNNVVTEITDAQGQPLDDPKLSKERVRNEISYLNSVSNYIGDAQGWKPREWRPRYRQTDKYLQVGDHYQFPQLEQWFGFVREESWICFQPSRKQPVARLDARGFQPVSEAPPPFAREDKVMSLRSDCFIIWNQTNVRIAYLAKREIVDLPLPAPLPIFGVANAWAQSPQGLTRVTGLAFQDGLAVYDDAENFLTMLPYSQDVSRWGRISMDVTAERDRIFLWYKPSAWIDSRKAKAMPSFFEEVDLQGRVIRSTTLDPLPEFPRPKSLTQRVSQPLQSLAMFFGDMGYRKAGAMLGSVRLQNALKSQLVDRWPQTREHLLWMTGLSVLCAAAACFLALKAGFAGSTACAWTTFVFAFNLAGLLVFRLVVDWPRQKVCRSCHKPRPIHRDLCPGCGQDWETPALSGTEIIDRSPVTPGIARTT